LFVGRPSTGTYPHISRKQLASVLDLHISTVSGILSGRIRPKAETAIIIAKEIGVPLDRLLDDLRVAAVQLADLRLKRLRATTIKRKTIKTIKTTNSKFKLKRLT
jgi:transcriptional regulator with XRE-family HTH domain